MLATFALVTIERQSSSLEPQITLRTLVRFAVKKLKERILLTGYRLQIFGQLVA